MGDTGPDHMFLIEFVEDKSNNSLCDVGTLKNCDDQSFALLLQTKNDLNCSGVTVSLRLVF